MNIKTLWEKYWKFVLPPACLGIGVGIVEGIKIGLAVFFITIAIFMMVAVLVEYLDG